MSKAKKELGSSLNKLSLSEKSLKKTSFKKEVAVADSWEDDDLSSGDETDRPLTAQTSNDYPNAPPPTPISPTTSHSSYGSDFVSSFGGSWNTATVDNNLDGRGERKIDTRPEKTDAVAKRLIAGALGVRAPKKTDEQRAYDRAIKEKEIKKRNGEKEAKLRAEEEAARAKTAAWDD